MKLFGIFTLAQLTTGSSVSHRQRRRDVADLIEDSPLNKCTRFITANTFNNQFVVNKRLMAFEKRGCEEYTFDGNFCTRVCKLQEGDRCSMEGRIGEDQCGSGLMCDYSTSRYATCQPMFENDDFSDFFSSDSLDDFLDTLNF